MSKRNPQILLQDIRRALDKVERYMASLDLEGFLRDEKTSDAVVRNLEIIGEAVKQLPPEFTAKYPHVPWAQISGLRNRIVHDYAGVDLEIIWQIVQTSLPQFKSQLESLDS